MRDTNIHDNQLAPFSANDVVWILPTLGLYFPNNSQHGCLVDRNLNKLSTMQFSRMFHQLSPYTVLVADKTSQWHFVDENGKIKKLYADGFMISGIRYYKKMLYILHKFKNECGTIIMDEDGKIYVHTNTKCYRNVELINWQLMILSMPMDNSNEAELWFIGRKKYMIKSGLYKNVRHAAVSFLST